MNRLFAAIALLFSILPLNAQNLLTDGSFEKSTTDWTLYVNTDKTAKAVVSYPTTGAQDGTKFARVMVTTVSDQNWHIQLQDPAWTCKKGVEYHISFYAKADAVHTIQVAVSGDSASQYAYRVGTEFSLTTEWKKINVYYKSDVAGSNATSFAFFCGYAVGVYDFDNVVIEESKTVLPTTILLPTQSCWESKSHRNLFAELGYGQGQIDDKINSAFKQLFFGDSSTEALYTSVGAELGFINQPGSGSIFSEGQSYGMMICLQMNRQDIFDRLWKFAYTYMMYHSGDRSGTFASKVKETSPYSITDSNATPDAEEYIVTSLLFAANRWGNKDGIFNYQKQADSILTTMLHKASNSTVVPEINSQHAMIIFSPVAKDTQFTNPGYHLPAFYSVWGKFASSDNDYWRKMADSSRAFLKRASNATTGLSSDYASFDGKPYPVSSNRFAAWYHTESWRTPMNIAVDYAWCKADPWQIDQTVKTLKFFISQSGDYLQTYDIKGTAQSESATQTQTYTASAGQIACNAVAALASNDTVAWKFVDRLWKLPIPSGAYRYYNALLTMMGLLHVSGKFLIWQNIPTNIDVHVQKSVPVQSFVKGEVTIMDLNGKVIATVHVDKEISTAKIRDLVSKTQVSLTNRTVIATFIDTHGSKHTQRIAMIR